MGDRRIMLIFTGMPAVFVQADDTHMGTTRAIEVVNLLWNIDDIGSQGLHEQFAHPVPGSWILPSWRLKRGELREEGPIPGFLPPMFYYVWLKGPAQDYELQIEKLWALNRTLLRFANLTGAQNYMWVVRDDSDHFIQPSANSEPLPIRLMYDEDIVQAVYPNAPNPNSDLP